MTTKYFTEDAEKLINSWMFDEQYPDLGNMNISAEEFQKALASIAPYNVWDYVCKYVFEKNRSEFKEKNDYREVSDERYVDIIESSFEMRGVPYLKEGQNKSDGFIRKQKANAKNTKTTERSSQLRWIMGLGMNSEEGDLFLKKCFHSHGFNFRSPLECILEYVMRTGQTHEKALEILKKYSERAAKEDFSIRNDNDVNTKYYATVMKQSESDEELINSLISLAAANISRGMKKEECYPDRIEGDFFTTMKNYSLYPSSTQIALYKEVLTDYKDSLFRIENIKLINDGKEKLPDDRKEEMSLDVVEKSITEIDTDQIGDVQIYFEEMYGEDFKLFIESWGEYIGSKVVSLTKHKMEGALAGKRAIDRYEVIMLCFLNYVSQIWLDSSIEDFKDIDNPYGEFKILVDDVLTQMGFHTFYTANPFEAFIAFCLMSANPEETFKISAIVANDLSKSNKENALK